MESENPHYDGGKPLIIGKLSTKRTTPAVARFPPTAWIGFLLVKKCGEVGARRSETGDKRFNMMEL